jgi:hypothetical protein
MVVGQQWRSDRAGAARKNARRSLIMGELDLGPGVARRGADTIIDGTNEAGTCKKTSLLRKCEGPQAAPTMIFFATDSQTFAPVSGGWAGTL